MVHISTAIVAVKTLTLVLGALLTLLSYRAYRRTRADPLRALALGFGIVTLGSLAAGVVHRLTPFDILVGILVHSVLILIGFAVITYSEYMD